MALFTDTPKIYFVTFAFLFVGGLFLLIAFATPHWFELVGYVGLWQVCSRPFYGTAICVSTQLLYKSAQFHAIQALSCIALLFAAGSGVAALAFVPMKSQQKTLAACIGIAVFMFGISFSVNSSFNTNGVDMSLGWSFILAALATASLAVASILAFVMACNIRPANALPTSGVVHYNPQGTPGNIQYAGAQYNPQTVPGQYGQQYIVPGQQAGGYPGQHPG